MIILEDMPLLTYMIVYFTSWTLELKNIITETQDLAIIVSFGIFLFAITFVIEKEMQEYHKPLEK